MAYMIRRKPKDPKYKEVFGTERYLLYGEPAGLTDEAELDEDADV